MEMAVAGVAGVVGIAVVVGIAAGSKAGIGLDTVALQE
jgi:hypothetical protein